jgi:death-on-curing protein
VAVLAIHDALLAEHGGKAGLLRPANLDAALAAPQQLLAYGDPDVFALAARHAFAVTRNHPFLDGNKRVALTVSGTFLDLNGQALMTREAEAAAMTAGLADRKVREDTFSEWLRQSCKSKPGSPRRRRPKR